MSALFVEKRACLSYPHCVLCSPQDKAGSKFYLNGFGRFGREARYFAVAASLVSRVSEGFQHELLTDTRVAIRLNELWGAASKELKWVVDIPDHVYTNLARVVGGDCDPCMVKHDVLAAAHVSYHFLWGRVFEPAQGLPWSLCRGDMKSNFG